MLLHTKESTTTLNLTYLNLAKWNSFVSLVTEARSLLFFSLFHSHCKKGAGAALLVFLYIQPALSNVVSGNPWSSQ